MNICGMRMHNYTRGSYQHVDSSSICVSVLQVMPRREFLAHLYSLCLRNTIP